MTTDSSPSTEMSVPVGASLLLAGAGTWVAQFFLGVFVGWEAAIPVGGLLVALGILLCFPDMRLYSAGRSPLEGLIVGSRSEAEHVDPVEP